MVGTRSRRKSAVLEPAPEEGVPTTPPVKKPRKRAATIEAAPEVVLPPALIDASIIQAFRSEDDIRVAAEHVMLMDPVLMPILEEHGHPTKLLKQQEHSVFQALVRSIIFQQLHGKAATAIYERVLGICKNPITPAAILGAPPLELRGCGLSERKVEYLTCLATRFTESNLSDDEINKMSDQQLKDELTKVKGIGPWSVDMLMMFNLGRVNVLPVGDLAVRKGMQQLYKLSTLPTPVQMETIARRWEPYRSIGTYLMWRIPTPKQSPKPKTIKSAAKSFPSAGRV